MFLLSMKTVEQRNVESLRSLSLSSFLKYSDALRSKGAGEMKWLRRLSTFAQERDRKGKENRRPRTREIKRAARPKASTVLQNFIRRKTANYSSMHPSSSLSHSSSSRRKASYECPPQKISR
jgi:hypothetical protein